MENTRLGFEDFGGSIPPQPCNKSYDWGASLSGEFLQEIALHAGLESWGALRCVCQNWRRGISQAVRTVRLTVPDRSTAPAVQPPAEQLAADAPRPARRGAAAGRPPGRGAAAANHPQQLAPPMPQRQPQVPAADVFPSALQPDQGRQQAHSPNLQQQQQPHQNDRGQQPPPTLTAGRGFAASSGRPPPSLSLPQPPLPQPPDGPATAPFHSQRHHSANAAAVGSPAPTATAVAAARACPEAAAVAGPVAAAAGGGGGGGGDVSFGRIAAVVRRPPAFEPHHDLEPLNCVFNLHRQSTVAAVAAAAAAATAAAAAARIQGEASDSQAAGVASSVGSSSIVVWSFLEAADRLAAAFPLYDNLSLNFAEPLPLAACCGGGGGGGSGSEVGSGRWLQLEMSSALQKLLSERLVALTLSGHTPFPLFMAPPPSPLPLPLPPVAAPPLPPASSPCAAVVGGVQPAGAAAAAAAVHHLKEQPRQHHRLQRSSKRSSVAGGAAAAAATAAAAAAVAAAAVDAAAAATVARVQGGEVTGATDCTAEGLGSVGVAGRATCRMGCGGLEGAMGGQGVSERGRQVPPQLATLPPPPPHGGRPHLQDHHSLIDNGRQPQRSGGCHVGALMTVGDAISPWRSRHVAAEGSGGILTVADIVKTLEEEATEDDPMGLGPTWVQVGVGPGSSSECGAASGAAGVGAASRRRRRASPAADGPPSTTAPPSAPYTFRADKSLTPPSYRTEGPPAQRQCCEGGAVAAAGTTKAEARRDVLPMTGSAGALPGALAPAAPAALVAEPKSPAATTANGYLGSSGSAPSHGSLDPRRYPGSGYAARLEADGSGAAGNGVCRERCGSGVPNTPGLAEGGYCAFFEEPNSGGSGGDLGGNGGGSGDAMDLGYAGDGAAVAAFMEANGSGRSPCSGDDDVDVCADGVGGSGFEGCGGGGLTRLEYGKDPMYATGSVQAAPEFLCARPNPRCRPKGSAAAAVEAAAATDAMILEGSRHGGGGGGGAPNGGGGGSSDGNGSWRGGDTAAGYVGGGRRCPAPGAAAAAAAGARATAGSDSNPSHGPRPCCLVSAGGGAAAHVASSRGGDDHHHVGEPASLRHSATPATAQAPAAATVGDAGGGGGGGGVTEPVAPLDWRLAGAEAVAAPTPINNERASPAAATAAEATASAAAARAAATAAAAAPPAPPPMALLPLGGSHRLGGACAGATPPALGTRGSGGGAGGGGRAVPLLSRLSQLVSLTLVADVRFPSPQQLEAVTALRALQRLDLRGAKFMQVDGDALGPLSRQAWLHLGNDHVAVVARCTSLTSLSLNHLHPVSGPQLVALTALGRLTSLVLTDALSGNSVYGSHIKALAGGLSNLRSLEIGRVTCPPLHLPPPQQPQQLAPPQQPPTGAAGTGAALSAHVSVPPATPQSWQPWGPVLGLFQRLTTLHLQVACSFETELLSGVAALPLLESFSMELLDVPPPQLAAMLEMLTAGPAGSAGGGADSGSPPKAAPLPPLHRHGRRAAAAAAGSGGGGGLSRVLRGLTLTACMLYDEHLELMGRLRQLRCIRLDQVDIRTRDPDGWTALSGARSLETFSFRVWNNPVLSASNLCVLTNDSLAMMAANWPKLQHLNYCGKVSLTEKAEEHVAHLTRLTSLDISGTDGTLLRVWRSAADGQLLRSVTLPYNATAKVSSRNGYVTYSDSDDSAKSEGSEASVNWMGDMGCVTSEYDAD